MLEIPGTSYTDADIRYTYRLAEQENIWEYYFALFERITQKVDNPFTLTNEGFASENYPYVEALREATVNMLMHADYFSPAKSRVRIFTNHIEFLNPGGLPKPLKLLMNTDISIPRNRTIAILFRMVKLAENAGFGFDRMNKGWATYSKTPPEYMPERDFMIVKFFIDPVEAKKDKIAKDSSPKGSPKSLQKDLQKSLQKGLQKSSQKGLQKSSQKIIQLYVANPKITTTEIAKILNISRQAVAMQIRKLKEQGELQRIGPAKGGYWKVVTDKDE